MAHRTRASRASKTNRPPKLKLVGQYPRPRCGECYGRAFRWHTDQWVCIRCTRFEIRRAK